ncbi:MAG: DUF2125 domain-containing protein [Pseudomonadota bacterium]
MPSKSSTHFFGALGVVAVVAVPTIGTADLSPDALWQEWESIAAAKDLRLDVERREQSTGSLSLFGLSAEFVAPIGGDTVVFSAPEMRLQTLDEDSVAITTPQGMRLEYTSDASFEANLVFVVASEDLTITASGSPDAVAYDSQASELEINLEEAKLPGLTESRFDYQVEGFSGSINGWTASTDPGQIDISILSDAAAVDYHFAFPAIGRETTARSSSTENTMSVEIETPFLQDGAILEGGSLTQRASAASGHMRNEDLTAGERTVSDISYENSQTELTLTEKRGSLQATVAEIDAKGSNSSLPMSDIAFTISGTYIDLGIPIAQDPAPQDASLTLSLDAINVDDGVWNLLEPAGALARAPLATQIDLAAKVLVGPAARLPQIPDAIETAPFRFTEVTINLLDLEYSTAKVTGEGAVEFVAPPPDSPIFQPTPAGQLDLTLQGIPELLEAVAKSGLVPPQQMMGAQMFLGMFTRPEEDGSLKSQIEAKPSGELFVNGIQLR